MYRSIFITAVWQVGKKAVDLNQRFAASCSQKPWPKHASIFGLHMFCNGNQNFMFCNGNQNLIVERR